VRRGRAAPLRPLSAICLVMALLVYLSSSVQPAGAQGSSDWTQYLDGPAHSSYNAEATSITVPGIKAGDLEPVWRWVPPGSTNGASTALMASPTVVDGVVYIGVEDGEFYAIDEATHSVLWSRYLGYDAPKPAEDCEHIYTQGITSTAAVLLDPVKNELTVYVNSPDGNLYALDAATGAVSWQAVVDVPAGQGRRDHHQRQIVRRIRRGRSARGGVGRSRLDCLRGHDARAAHHGCESRRCHTRRRPYGHIDGKGVHGDSGGLRIGHEDHRRLGLSGLIDEALGEVDADGQGHSRCPRCHRDRARLVAVRRRRVQGLSHRHLAQQQEIVASRSQLEAARLDTSITAPCLAR
jgi:hypothetical protein